MKEPKKKIDSLSEADAERLLQYMKADKSKDELTKTRDYAIVSVLMNTGLRVSELCNIKIEDVKNELQVIGKNNSLGLVFLFQEHITLLKLYLFLRE
jgi:site-specific recombinase XerD